MVDFWFYFFGSIRSKRGRSMNNLVLTLSESLINELVTAFGLPPTKFYHGLFWHLFRGITDRFAEIGASFDEITSSEGFPSACEWALSLFCKDVQSQGTENIPPKGPLLILTNHPGAYDALVIFSNLKDHSIRSVSTKIPFLKLLPNARQNFLFAPRDDSRERMIVMRNAIKHLQSGGTVNYFASGHRDPDPAVYPGAEGFIDHWLDIYDTFFRYIKGLKVMPVIVSGVVSKKWAKHPITWLRKKQIDRQRLAEFGQVISQLLKPGKFFLNPRISFGTPFTEAELRNEVGQGKLFPAVVTRGKALIRQSAAYFGGFVE